MTDTNTSGTTQPSGGEHFPSLSERSAAVFGPNTGQAPVAASNPAAEEGLAPGVVPSSTAGSGDDAARATARAERLKRLDELRASERERVDAQARHRQAADALRERDALRAKLEALEQRSTAQIDPTKLDEQGFFDLAEKLNVTPQKLGQWLQQRANNPEIIAAQSATKILDPKLSALEQKIAEQNERLQAFEQQRVLERQTAEAIERGTSMVSFAESSAEQAPYSAMFLREHGPEEFLTIANSVYASVPKGAGWEQAVLDQVEDNLAKLFAPLTRQPAQGHPQQRQAPSSTHAAAKAPTTVSNTLAQSRASVVDEERDWSSLPFEERSRRAFGL